MATAEITPQIEQAEPREVATSLADIADQERQHGSDFQDQQRSERAAQEQQEAADGEEANSHSEVDSEAEAAELGLDERDRKLPREQQKTYSRELMKDYAQRYGYSEEELSDRRVKTLIKSKIDTDIYIADLKAGRAAESEETEEAEVESDENQAEQTEEQKAEAERQAAAEEAQRASQQQQAAPLEQQVFARHMEEMHKECFDPRINHPEAIEMYAQHLAPLFGADTPEAASNMRQAVHAAVLGNHAQMLTTVPVIMRQHLMSMLDEALPGLREQHHAANAFNTWEDIRTAGKFGELPKFDSPEFGEAAKKVYGENPWLETITFRDAKGNALSRNHPQSMRNEANLVAKILSGERFNPQAVQAAIDKGKLEAQKTNRRVTAGRTLGSGKATGQMEKTEGLAGGSMMDAYRARNSGGF